MIAMTWHGYSGDAKDLMSDTSRRCEGCVLFDAMMGNSDEVDAMMSVAGEK